MVTIRPFKNLGPTKELAAQVASLPYDVLNTQEARAMAQDAPYSFLHIDKAEIDLPVETAPDNPLVYQQAADNLRGFKQAGWLVKEPQATFYIYRLTMGNHVQTGLVACAAIADYVANRIKKHELTRPDKELDRIRHSEACDANTSPVFLTYRSQPAIQQLLLASTQTEPLYDFTSFYEVRHQVWPVASQHIAPLVAAFDQVPALYIADGHHRTASAVKVGQDLAIRFPEATRESDYFLAVLFPKDELNIWDYNRLITAPLPDTFWSDLQAIAEIKESNDTKPQPQVIKMYVAGKWYQLTFKKPLTTADPTKVLDVSRLQQEVIAPIFGIKDVRRDERITFVGGIRGLSALAQAVDQAQATVAFALAPPTMDQLLQVADAGEIMPPKSTWFEPKLLSGLFLHEFESPQ